MRLSFWLVLLFSFVTAPLLPAQTQHSPAEKKHLGTATSTAEASRLNNLGAAYMNQQEFARALRLFRQAEAVNPKLDIARLNQAIALANLQRYGPATTI